MGDVFANILPTLLVVLTGLLTWFLKDKSEKLKLQREKLIEEKRINYKNLLEPVIRILSSIQNPSEEQKALKKIQSYDYRKTAFELMQFGSDEVVMKYNEFFQFLYRNEGGLDPIPMLEKLGDILLAIRKDLGYPKTKLTNKDMLKFMIKDIDGFI